MSRNKAKHLSASEATASALGELTTRHRTALNAHLKDCAKCQSEQQALQTLFIRAAAVGSMDAPDDAARLARIHRAVADAASINRQMPVRRVPVRARLVVAALLTGAAVAGVFVAPVLRPSQTASSSPAVAFAQVERAMQSVHTVSWTDTLIRSDGVTEKTNRHRYWARLDEKSAFLTHEMVEEFPFPRAHLRDYLSDARGNIYYSQYEKTYSTDKYVNPYLKKNITGNIKNPADVKNVPPNLRGVVLDTDFTRAVRLPWQKTAETRSGRVFLVFRSRMRNNIAVAESLHNDKSEIRAVDEALKQDRILRLIPPNNPRENSYAITLWVDPETHLVARMEAIIRSSREGQRNYTVHGVREYEHYNEMPPKGIFDWSEGDDAPAARDKP